MPTIYFQFALQNYTERSILNVIKLFCLVPLCLADGYNFLGHTYMAVWWVLMTEILINRI